MAKKVFIHIPKTAGTSFRSALCQGFGGQAVSPAFGAYRISKAQAAALENFHVICGHISLSDVNEHFPAADLFTILRDPIERCISWYQYVQGSADTDLPDVKAAKDHDIGSFFGLSSNIIGRNIFNRQVRQLSAHALDCSLNLDIALQEAKRTLIRCRWIGRQESIGEDFARLKAVFPEMRGVSLPAENMTVARIKKDDLDPAVIEKIYAHNHYDIQLYNFAKSIRYS